MPLAPSCTSASRAGPVFSMAKLSHCLAITWAPVRAAALSAPASMALTKVWLVSK